MNSTPPSRKSRYMGLSFGYSLVLDEESQLQERNTTMMKAMLILSFLFAVSACSQAERNVQSTDHIACTTRTASRQPRSNKSRSQQYRNGIYRHSCRQLCNGCPRQ